MKKNRTANLHHLYHEVLPEDVKLTPKVEVDNVHQRRTTDVYEHALTITAWQQIYDQLHPGKFHGEFTEILLDDIQVFREYTGLALRQSCLVWPNSFWLAARTGFPWDALLPDEHRAYCATDYGADDVR